MISAENLEIYISKFIFQVNIVFDQFPYNRGYNKHYMLISVTTYTTYRVGQRNLHNPIFELKNENGGNA